ncbi:MAG: sulfotransferase domain-containing protein [Alphaproteobacteria bacterium]
MEKLFDRPVALTVGPQGCGVPWIYDYIQARGDVCLPASAREIFYFDRHFQRGPEFYAQHFQPEPRHKLIMELTTTAFDSPEAPDQLFKLLGTDVKLICPLRHPVERSKAVYADYARYGLVKGGIEKAVEDVPQILYASRYAERLEPWLTQFGRENIHIVFYETLERDPAAFAAELCALAGLDFMPPRRKSAWQAFADFLRPQPNEAPVLSAREERWLETRLAQEIPALETRLGQPLKAWK